MDGNPFEALVPRAAPPPQGNPFDALVPRTAAPPPPAAALPPSTDDLQSDSEREVAAMAPVTAGITDWIKGILAQPAPMDRAAEAAKRVEGEGGDVGAIIRDPDYRAASRDISTGFAMGSGLPERRAVPPPGEAPRGVPGAPKAAVPAETPTTLDLKAGEPDMAAPLTAEQQAEVQRRAAAITGAPTAPSGVRPGTTRADLLRRAKPEAEAPTLPDDWQDLLPSAKRYEEPIGPQYPKVHDEAAGPPRLGPSEEGLWDVSHGRGPQRTYSDWLDDADPYKPKVILRDKSGRPIQRVPIPRGAADRIIAAIEERQAGGSNQPPPAGGSPPPAGGPPGGAPGPAAPGAASASVSRGAPAGQSAPSGVPPGTALDRPPDLTQPRAFEDQLFALESNGTADKLDVLKRAKALPDVPPATWEKLYHHEEDPKGVTLTPEEKAIYDEHVAPLADESTKLLSRLKELDVPLDPEGYTPRYVQGRTRSYGEMLDQWKKGIEAKFGGAPGRSMRTTVDAEKARRFYKAVNPDTGDAQVVYVAPDRSILRFDENTATNKFDLGPWSKLTSQKIQPGAKFTAGGKSYTLEQATTKEIEDVASVRYHKNVIANRLDNVQKLRSAVRNAEFIDGMKKSPDWDKVAVKVRDQSTPPETNDRPWRIPQMPQFRQFYMEPRLADAIDDFAKANRSIEGLQGGLDKIGQVIKASIFYNPIPHLANVWNHYLVERGLTGNLLHAPAAVRSGLKAIKAVTTQDDNYIKMLRSGASLPYARLLTNDVHKTLISKLGEAVQANPRQATALAKAFGYANPVEWIRGIYRASSHALWAGSDVMTMARILELQEKGIGIEQAIRQTEAHMPNYRVPGQVAGSRLLSQTLQSPLLSMFGRYQYNRLASYGEMARDLVSRSVPLAQKAETLDKLAMLGAYLTVFYPALDKAWQEITGNPHASTTRSGAASVPQAAMELVKGDKDLVQAGQSVFSPGVAMEVPAEVLFGRYLWNGQPIANIDDAKHLDAKFLADLAKYGASKIAPAGQAAGVFNDKEGIGPGLKRLGLAQLQVKSPSEQSFDSRETYKRRAEIAAERARQKAAAGRGSFMDKILGRD